MRDALLKMLKVVKNLSMDPRSRDALEQANIIPTLVQALAISSTGVERVQVCKKEQKSREGKDFFFSY